jgi:hypothetical protein
MGADPPEALAVTWGRVDGDQLQQSSFTLRMPFGPYPCEHIRKADKQ